MHPFSLDTGQCPEILPATEYLLVLHHIGGIYGHSPCLHPCVFLLGDGICGCRLVVFDNILYLRKQPRPVLFHRKKVMGVLSNYFLGDVNLACP